MAETAASDWDAAGREALLAALAWQLEAGADAAVAEAPVDRFALAAEEAARAPAPVAPRAATPRPPAMSAPAPRLAEGAARDARAAAAAAGDLAALHDAIRAFEGCALKKGARSTVIADGDPRARVMVIGEAPGREEDREGLPFVGRSGQLLDRMLAAIGLSRRAEDPAHAAYITNAVYWRPLENRRPSSDEVALLTPFLERHIELVRPEFILLAGAAPAQALLETELGISRLRGTWRRWRGVPVMATFDPAYLLRQPERKREVWRDLLALAAALDGEPLPD